MNKSLSLSLSFDSTLSGLYLGILHLVRLDQAVWFLRQKLLHMPLFPRTVHVNQNFRFPGNFSCNYASWMDSNTIQLTQIAWDNADLSKDHKLRIYLKRGLNKGRFLISKRSYIFCNNHWIISFGCFTIGCFGLVSPSSRPKKKRVAKIVLVQFPSYS